MLAIQIKDIKTFMKFFLVSDKFDEFELVQGTVSTFNVFDIDGHLNKTFFGEDYEGSPYEGHEYTPWNQIKDFVFSIIKGKHTPLSFKFILHAGEKISAEILPDGPDSAETNTKSLILTIRYDEHGLMLTSATAASTFSLDKSIDEAWDKWLSAFTQDMQ